MKTLNERAVKILFALIEKKTIHDIRTKVMHDCGRYRLISLTRHKHDEGWNWRDPEITIIHETATDSYIPSNVTYDFVGVNSNSASIYNGKLTVWNEKIQTDHADLTIGLLEEIAEMFRMEIQ